jgi:hypothetical protein
MANTGFTTPGTVTNNADAGAAAWSNPGNVVSDDGSTASVNSGASTQYLQATNFGFSIPTGSTINGVVARVQRMTITSITKDLTVQLIIGGTRTGNDKSSGTDWPATGSFNNADYGSSSDLWGTSLSVSDVNASNFGLAFRAQRSLGNMYAEVDVIWLDIYYTEPATGQPAIKRGGGVEFMGGRGGFGRGGKVWMPERRLMLPHRRAA